MTRTDPSSLTIGVVPDVEAAEAQQWLLMHSTPLPASCHRFAPQLLMAVTATRRIGVLGIQVLPGRTASLIGPRIDDSALDDDDVATALLAAAKQRLAGQVTMGQVLLDRDQQPQASWYRQAGYDTVIRLDFLVRTLDLARPPLVARSTEGLKWVEYGDASHERFLHVLQRSYEGSLDCAVLNGLRDAEDALAGHRAMGQFDPQRWRLLIVNGQDAGCLLLTEYPEDNQCEIVYLAIVPEFRGRGLGRAATNEALLMTAACGRPRLILAVDARNEPANRMYARAGFYCWAQKQVQLSIFPAAY